MSDTAKDQAIAQVQSIYEIVNVLNVDYDRLEELRDAKEDLISDVVAAGRDFVARETAEGVLRKWEDDNGLELSELEESAGDCESEDEARERIDEDPLSVEVRSSWCAPGEDMTASEFRIVLCTGGPHVEIIGDLDAYRQPSRVRVLYKDWGESGELFDFDREKVLRYCSVFYFGE